MSIPPPPTGLEVKVPHEEIYEEIYAKNTVEDLRRLFIPSITYESKKWEFTLYGTRIRLCDRKVEANLVESQPPRLEKGSIFYADGKFTVDKVMGPRTYLLTQVGSDEQRVLKIESTKRSRIGPFLNRHVLVANEATKRFRAFPNSCFGQHHLQVMYSGRYSDNAVFIIQELADCNLQDMLVKTLGGATPSRSTALQIAIQTLQGIHDLHMIGFIHRDIRLDNFYVGRGSNYRKIYLSGFDLVFHSYRDRKNTTSPAFVPKVRCINARYQSRNYHDGTFSKRLDDIESWIYMMIYVFCPDLLPWRKMTSERQAFNAKNTLVYGGYNLQALEPYFRPMLNQLTKIDIINAASVDFPYFLTLLENMATSWKFTGKEPWDWEPGPDGRHQPAKNIERNTRVMMPVKLGDDKLTQDIKASTSQARTPSRASTAQARTPSKASPRESKANKMEDGYAGLEEAPKKRAPTEKILKNDIREDCTQVSKATAAAKKTITKKAKKIEDDMTQDDGESKNVKKSMVKKQKKEDGVEEDGEKKPIPPKKSMVKKQKKDDVADEF